MKNEKGSITLYVLLSMLFFLVVVGSSNILMKNRESEIDREISRVKKTYEEVMFDAKKFNSQIEVEESGSKKVKVKLKISSYGDYNIYLKNFVNTTPKLIYSGTDVGEVIVENIDTKFDVNEFYAELNDNGKVYKTEICSFEDLKIADKAELEYFSNKVNAGKDYDNKTITQIENIDLENIEWTAIGKELTPFKGRYNGNNLKINNLYINNDLNNQGLFGYNLGIIENLTVSGAVNSTENGIGGIVGFNKGQILKCTGNINVTGSYRVGGIVGINESGTVELCVNTGEINSTNDANNLGVTGGIVGRNNNGTIEKCINYGDVYFKANSGGGITGSNYSNAKVNLCVNKGKIERKGEKAYSGLGGIAGYQEGDSSVVSNSYNFGEINSQGKQSRVGGIIGDKTRGTLKNCYNAGSFSFIETRVKAISGYGDFSNCYYINTITVDGGTATSMSEEEMKSIDFLNLLNTEEVVYKSDYTNANSINNGFPILIWQ